VSVFVVDASVVVKWFVPEVHSDAARRLLVLPHEYIAPDLLFAETANTIWKKIRRQELTTEEGQQLVADIRQIAVETVPCRPWRRTHMHLRTQQGEPCTIRCTLPWRFESTRARSPRTNDSKLH
jgi:predicted nucleic acid-binding protein